MQAVEITAFGAPDVLRLGERPQPVAGAAEVLIRVSASGVNRPDVLQRTGNYPVPPGASDIPGLEVAGVIVEGDAARLTRILSEQGIGSVSAVVSSLPLLSLPADVVRGIVEGVFDALPRGGVPVALPIAEGLHAPLDLLLVRKLGVPWQPELSFGAIAEGLAVLHAAAAAQN